MTNWCLVIAVVLALQLMGCANTTSRIDNKRGRSTHYGAPDTVGGASGIGLESQDIVSMTDRMVRDILSTEGIGSRSEPPRIVVDSEYFQNQSSSIVNKNLLTDRLRVGLVRAAEGRLIFLARHQAEMLEEERSLEEIGKVSGGTDWAPRRALGYDFRLGGRIASLDSIDPKKGLKTRYHQITFELVERGSGVIVWTNNYELKKSAIDDVVYR